MNKLQVEFAVVAAPADPKTNTIVITSITTESGDKYVLPEEYRNVTHHNELKKTNTFKSLKETARRGDRKNLWIVLSDELQETYIDEAENIRFKNYFLDKVNENKQQSKNEENNDLKRLLEQLVISNQRKNSHKDLKSISEKFLLERFSSKTINVKQWLETFEKECTRFEIVEENMMIEILRLFLDKPCTDWYYATIAKLEQNNNWHEWKARILETFADKGWSSWRYALAFKYKAH